MLRIQIWAIAREEKEGSFWMSLRQVQFGSFVEGPSMNIECGSKVHCRLTDGFWFV